MEVEPPLEIALNVVRIAVTFTWCLSCFISLNERSHVPVLCLFTLRLLFLYSSLPTKSDYLDILKTKVLPFSGLGLAWFNSVTRFLLQSLCPIQFQAPATPHFLLKAPVIPVCHDQLAEFLSYSDGLGKLDHDALGHLGPVVKKTLSYGKEERANTKRKTSPT